MGEHPRIKVEFVHGRFDRSAVGGFTYTTLAAAHEMERRMVGEKRADTDARKASRGEARGMAPYGYLSRDGRFVVDDEAPEDGRPSPAAVVRQIFADYASGEFSAKALSEKLNRDGAPRTFQPRNKHGWMPDTVVDTLRNVAYLGKTYDGQSSRRAGERIEDFAKRRSELKLIKARWDAIVDDPTFRHVQRLMDGRKVATNRQSAPADYIFGRLLVCSRCGGIMRATRTQGHAYYHCRRDVAVPCESPAVREDVLMAWANALFERIKKRGELNIEPLPPIEAATKKPRPNRSLASIEKTLERLEVSWAAGRLSDATYKAERAKYEQLFEEVKAAPAATAPPPDYEFLTDAWRRANGDPAIYRHTLNRIFDALFVEDGEVKRYRPRAEYRRNVEQVISWAMEGGGFKWSAPRTGRGSNLSKQARHERRTSRLQVDGGRGKGGIRTLEGALHPLPA
jgi:hypothetical protein